MKNKKTFCVNETTSGKCTRVCTKTGRVRLRSCFDGLVCSANGDCEHSIECDHHKK